MERLGKIIAIVRDVVWTALGILLLVAVVIVLVVGPSQLLPAGLGNGNGSGGGQGANQQGGGNGPTPGNQQGPGGAQPPGNQQGPGGAQPPGGQPPAQGGGGPISVAGSGSFGGVLQGSHVTGNFTVQAIDGALERAAASFTLQLSTQGSFTFMGQVTCILGVGTNPARAIVAGTIRDSNDPSKMPKGSGFVLGLLDDTPDQIAFEAGFPISDPKAICPNEAPNLFTTNHPGFNVTSGDIAIH